MNGRQFAFRQLTRLPGRTLPAAGLLALGVAGNAIIFSLCHAVLLTATSPSI